jgi:TonB family protein
MREDALFFGLSSEQSSLCKRLFELFSEAFKEFRKDPQQFIIRSIKGDGIGGRRRKILLQYGLAISILVYATFFLATLTFWTLNHRPDNSLQNRDGLVFHTPLYFPPFKQETPLSKADKDAENGGGGGGGDQMPNPASQGQRPDFALEPPPLAPTTRPTITPPSLPMIEQLRGDPKQNLPRDDLAPTGLPEGVVGPPSDGQGKKNGIGTGEDGGVGSGKKRGYGPGEDGGKDGGKYEIGSRRPNPADANEAVDARPIALNKPRPNYTEEARKNKVQGAVRARVLVGADGFVKQVKISGAGLPDGLNEQAIEAAKQMRFQPATKNGQAVAYWVTVDIEFNIR